MVKTSQLGYLSPNVQGLQNHLCVLPCGGLSERDVRSWTVHELEPCVSYMLNGQGIDRMFGGFIFNGISTRPNHYIHPLYIGFGQSSELTDWSKWIDDLFAPDHNFHALAKLADQAKRTLDVWVSVPYPHPFQRNFGIIGNKPLNFLEEADRYHAVSWWIAQFIQRWQQQTQLHARLIFRGFLWQKEAVHTSDQELVKKTNQYIKSQKLHSIWLPNYGTYGVTDWQNLGFDVTVINANFYGNTLYDHSWINITSQFSKVLHTGIQIVCGKGIIYKDTDILDYFNLGLAEQNGYMEHSFLVYQFPNQTVRQIYETRFVDYIRLYTFIKGLYTKVSYPGITY